MTEPVCTYRLQFRPGFGFAQAREVIDYLAELGISHVYSSPYLQANTGSTHGYDVVDHGRISEDLGGEEEHARFCEALRQRGLGQLLDVVPNHMAVGPRNPWWWDVLENGPSSRYAAFFDVEWAPPEKRLHNKMLLPVLGDHYGRVLESGQLRLRRVGGLFTLHYHEHSFPVAPRSLATVLEPAARACHSMELAFIADAFAALPLPTATDHDSVDRRHRDKQVLLVALARLCAEQPRVAEVIDRAAADLARDPNAFDEFLAAQNYRLAYWKSGARDLGYRRFFDISGLIGLRMEDGRVFDETHALVLRLIEQGLIDGLRVDHPDGLLDPEGYFRRLRSLHPKLWIVAEKILTGDERLPANWPIDGTTGYEFMNVLAGVFIDPAGEAPLTRLFEGLTGEHASYLDIEQRCKRLVLNELLASDLNRLTALFLDICEQHRSLRDYTRHECHEVLRETLVAFPVYRSYVWPAHPTVSPQDRAAIERGISLAKSRKPEVEPALFDALAAIWLLERQGRLESELVGRLQQLSGAIMAKGVEDTAFYQYNRLVALNEVGGAPERFGRPPAELHAWCMETAATHPRTLLGTSTHDSKRSEDVRARLWLLSEIPERWEQAVRRWVSHNDKHRRSDWPDRNTEYLFYQILVGAWPLDCARAQAFMEKAVREAKLNTSWTDQKVDFEQAVRDFVAGAMADGDFMREVATFVAPLVEPGRHNGLAQVLIKLTAPGVPDIYQGCETWDLSLVDPDNRRPVDFLARQRLLADVREASPEDVLRRMEDGAPKMWLIHKALAARRRWPALFGAGAGYRPLEAEGERAEHVFAFLRGDAAATVVTRWPLRLAGRWGDTHLRLPGRGFVNLLTGDALPEGRVCVAELLRRFPVALLLKRKDRP